VQHGAGLASGICCWLLLLLRTTASTMYVLGVRCVCSITVCLSVCLSGRGVPPPRGKGFDHGERWAGKSNRWKLTGRSTPCLFLGTTVLYSTAVAASAVAMPCHAHGQVCCHHALSCSTISRCWLTLHRLQTVFQAIINRTSTPPSPPLALDRLKHSTCRTSTSLMTAGKPLFWATPPRFPDEKDAYCSMLHVIKEDRTG
jgi:hypothetical protein